MLSSSSVIVTRPLCAIAVARRRTLANRPDHRAAFDFVALADPLGFQPLGDQSVVNALSGADFVGYAAVELLGVGGVCGRALMVRPTRGMVMSCRGAGPDELLDADLGALQ
ncbi:MAG: hypothetical protein R2709_05790 [Marmoricola sp.]